MKFPGDNEVRRGGLNLNIESLLTTTLKYTLLLVFVYYEYRTQVSEWPTGLNAR